MTDIPIIFSAPMVRALLDGRKTMTRRLLKPQPEAYQNEYCTRLRFSNRSGREVGDASPNLLADGSCPAAIFTRYGVGDRLWVRENFAPIFTSPTTAIYRADGEKQPGACCGCAWKPSIHMPRWASRLTLIVTSSKVERLQDISEVDATAEGVEPMRAGVGSDFKPIRTYRTGFVGIWRDIHGEDSWLANPWVVAISFKVIRSNVDAVEALAA